MKSTKLTALPDTLTWKNQPETMETNGVDTLTGTVTVTPWRTNLLVLLVDDVGVDKIAAYGRTA